MARNSKDKKKREEVSYDDKRAQFLLEKHPLTQSLDRKPPDLPAVAAPSLDGLAVTVPAPVEPTAEDVERRMREIAEAVAPSAPKKAGEPVALGDQVCLNILGYAGDRLIPFSARENAWMAVTPEPTLPGFFEALAGKAVAGAPLRIPVVLPKAYPVAALRGVTAVFVVQVVAARTLSVPPIDDEAFLRSLGRGKTLDAVLESVIKDLRELARSHAQLQAENRVLDEVTQRAHVKVPESLIDEEIRRRWVAAEGEMLARRGFNQDQLTEAQDGWVHDPATRDDIRRRLAISLTLRAIAVRDHVHVTAEKVKEVVNAAAGEFGFQVPNVAEALAGEEQASEQVASVAAHLATVEHVMKHAKVTFAKR